MCARLKSTGTLVLKWLVAFVIIIILQKSCNCNRQTFFPKPKSNYIQMTSIRCLAIDPMYVKITKCILKAHNRTDKYVMGSATLLKTFVRPILVYFRIMKRATGGYKPFGIDVTLDGCDYMEGKRNKIFDWFFKLIFLYSNINHTCPYSGDVIFNVPIKQVKFPSVFPDGDYLFVLEFGTLGKSRGGAHAYITLKEV